MTLFTPATPPMGWNSWDCYGTAVTEDEVLANARFMAEHLLPFGWDTVVVDIDWADPSARSHGYNDDAPLVLDAWGRLQPDPVRFPSSAGGAGFAPLAAQVHELGLKFGIHVMRGIPRRAVQQRLPVAGASEGTTAADVADLTTPCEWNPDMWGLDHSHPGAQASYDAVLELYARWGVDFLKADDMLWPYRVADIEAFARAIERCGRPIALSLSPGRDLSLARLEHLRGHATMWRICDDLWDRWDDVEANFARFARWAPHAGEQGWPDGDMLPLGRIGIRAERGVPRDDLLTPAERVTLMTLWVVARSPLMIGGDLPSSAPETIALFTHPAVMKVAHSQARGRELFREGDLVVWGADDPVGQRWAAVFNLADQPHEWTLDAGNLGLEVPRGAVVQELWTGEAVPVTRTGAGEQVRGVGSDGAALHLSLAAHGAVLLKVEPGRG